MIPGPLSVIAEITHLCPLKCIYCSNPIELAKRQSEISTEDWRRVIREAAEMGAAQISFTGGEPCLRSDLPELVAEATRQNMYVNLITSGVGVSEKSLATLVEAGVEHIQLSFQDSDSAQAREICGVDAFNKKKKIGAWIAQQPIAFTINLVIHQMNHARLNQMIKMAVELGCTKIEVAHVQFNGWALKNRARLMPSENQVRESMRLIKQSQEDLRGRVRIDYVLPDYYAQTPKPCMGGWAQKMLLINPQGLAAPCHSAETIPGLKRPSVLNQDLRSIWFESEMFNAFRGDAWMPDPCRSCDKRFQDFAGCRCQAMALTGDARQADPVCRLAPGRPIVDKILNSSEKDTELVYRA